MSALLTDLETRGRFLSKRRLVKLMSAKPTTIHSVTTEDRGNGHYCVVTMSSSIVPSFSRCWSSSDHPYTGIDCLGLGVMSDPDMFLYHQWRIIPTIRTLAGAIPPTQAVATLLQRVDEFEQFILNQPSLNTTARYSIARSHCFCGIISPYE